MKERGKEGPWEGRIWVWKGRARLDSRRVSKKPDLSHWLWTACSPYLYLIIPSRSAPVASYFPSSRWSHRLYSIRCVSSSLDFSD